MTDVRWDPASPQHRFWPGDSACGHLVTRFSLHVYCTVLYCTVLVTRFSAPHTLRPRALVSYPGSGNTWIRSGLSPVEL